MQIRAVGEEVTNVTLLIRRRPLQRADVLLAGLVVSASLAVLAYLLIHGFAGTGVTPMSALGAMGQSFTATIPSSFWDTAVAGLANAAPDSDLSYESFSEFVSMHPTFIPLHLVTFVALAIGILVVVWFVLVFHLPRLASKVAYAKFNPTRAVRSGKLHFATHGLIQPSPGCEYPPAIAPAAVDGAGIVTVAFAGTALELTDVDGTAVDVGAVKTGADLAQLLNGAVFVAPDPVDLAMTPEDFYATDARGAPASLTEDEAVGNAAVYGDNSVKIPTPKFADLFLEHVMSPWFVFQVISCLLWMLDSYGFYPFVTIAMLAGMESFTVSQRLSALKELAALAPRPSGRFRVLRAGRWTEVPAVDLVPGDVVDLVSHADPAPVPADIVIIDGDAIAEEASLTGESVPCPKIALRRAIDQGTVTSPLDVTPTGAASRSVLFAGTDIVAVTPGGSAFAYPSAPQGCVGVVIRTGWQTAQGQLIRRIVYVPSKAGAVDSKESLSAVLVLLAAGIAAAVYVVRKGFGAHIAPLPKLLLQGIIIVTSVVPPELPTQLALCINSSLAKLKEAFIYCTLPAAIPAVGRARVVAFDKTGTITADASEIVGIDTNFTARTPTKITDLGDTAIARLAFAACHDARPAGASGEIVGDETEVSALRAVGCHFVPRASTPLKGVGCTGHATALPAAHVVTAPVIVNAFTSMRRCMSVVASVHTSDDRTRGTYVFAKGAPEAVMPMLSTIPEGLEKAVDYYMYRGFRTMLVAGHKVSSEILTDRQATSRYPSAEDAEAGLELIGILVIRAPLAPNAREVVAALQEGSISAVMVTGDALPTAAAVAAEAGIYAAEDGRPVLELVDYHASDAEVVVRALGHREESTVTIDALDAAMRMDTPLVAYPCTTRPPVLVATGAFLRKINETTHAPLIVPRVRVFARTSPTEKAIVVQYLKNACTSGAIDEMRAAKTPAGRALQRRLGIRIRVIKSATVLFVGDGSNDVAALRTADAGVAVLRTAEYSDLCTTLASIREKRITELAAVLPRVTGERARAINHEIETLRNAPSEPDTAPKMQRNPQQQMEEARRRMALTGKTTQQELQVIAEENRQIFLATRGRAYKRIIEARKQGKTVTAADQMKANLSTTPFGSIMGAFGGSGDDDTLGDDDSSAPMGAASIAAPVTLSSGRLNGLVELIRGARACLVTAQSQSVSLALTCIVSAYSLSVLSLAGVRQADIQLSASGMAVTAMAMMASWPKPAKHLSPLPPPRSLISLSSITSFVSLAVVQIASLWFAQRIAGGNSDVVAFSTKFAPSLMNTVMFMVQTALMATTTVLTYAGKPHCVSILESRSLMLAAAAAAGFCVVITMEYMPEVNSMIKLVPLPASVKKQLISLLVTQLVASVGLDRLAALVFAPRPITRDD